MKKEQLTNGLLGIFLVMILLFTRWENYRWILPVVVMISCISSFWIRNWKLKIGIAIVCLVVLVIFELFAN